MPITHTSTRSRLAAAANVESDVKVQRIGTVAGDLDVLGTAAQALQGLGDRKAHFGLAGAEEDDALEPGNGSWTRPSGP